MHDAETGEKHIADVRTDNGLVVEFQNSPIKEQEKISRDDFYENIIWLVNATNWKQGLTLGRKLPDPDSDIAGKVVFCPIGSCAPLSLKPLEPDFGLILPPDQYKDVNYEIPHGDNDVDLLLVLSSKGPPASSLIRRNPLSGKLEQPVSKNKEDSSQEFGVLSFKMGFDEPGLSVDEDEVERSCTGHHFFHCERDINLWMNSRKPVFFDCGVEDELLEMMIFGNRTFHCLRRVNRAEFVTMVREWADN